MAASVVIGYCHDGRSVDSFFHDCLVATVRADAAGPRRVVDVVSVGGGPRIASNRNAVVKAFVEHEDRPEWLWMLDTDMTFAPDTLERMLAVADPEHVPILGALCFAAGRGAVVLPTMYALVERQRADGGATVGHIEDWPPHAVVRVDATGAACLLIHRRVLEAMRDHVPPPHHWFAEGVDPQAGTEYSEDWTFCVRATRLGFPIHVCTAIEVGHRKPYVWTSRDFALWRRRRAEAGGTEAARAAEARREIGLDVVEATIPLAAQVDTGPVYVVVAYRDRPSCVDKLVAGLLGGTRAPDAIYVFDNGSEDPWRPPPDLRVFHERRASAGLHDMWNEGLLRAEADARRRGATRWCVLITNDDIEVEPDTLALLARGLRSDDRIGIAYPDSFDRGLDPTVVAPTVGCGGADGMAGWCFMLAGETGWRIDPRFEWWYGDTDLERRCRLEGRLVVRVNAAQVRHLYPNASTESDPALAEAAARDRQRFRAKWGVA